MSFWNTITNCTYQKPFTYWTHRKISDLQAFEIETADDAGIGPKAAHELASHQVGGPLNLSYTLHDHKNYLRTKQKVQNEKELGLIRSTRLKKRDKTKLQHSLRKKQVMMLHKHK